MVVVHGGNGGIVNIRFAASEEGGAVGRSTLESCMLTFHFHPQDDCHSPNSVIKDECQSQQKFWPCHEN